MCLRRVGDDAGVAVFERDHRLPPHLSRAGVIDFIVRVLGIGCQLCGGGYGNTTWYITAQVLLLVPEVVAPPAERGGEVRKEHILPCPTTLAVPRCAEGVLPRVILLLFTCG
jgi:hypothetical protein